MSSSENETFLSEGDNLRSFEHEGFGIDLVGNINKNSNEDKELEEFKKFLMTKSKKRKKEKMKLKNENPKFSDDLYVNHDIVDINMDVEFEGYTYTDLLNRAYRKLDKPISISRINLPKLSISPVGGKKTGWGNFSLICSKINRDPQHVKTFFLTEMQTTGNVLKSGGLLFLGKWRNKHIESILNKYRKFYINCNNCKSCDTIIQKDKITKLYFLKCNQCQSSRSIQNIKNGYLPTSKRSRLLKKKNQR